MRRGIGLTEILLAFAIIGAAFIPTMTLFGFTSRSASDVSVLFRQSVLAQLLLESIKGRQELDPHFLDPAHLEGEYGFVRTDWICPDGSTVPALVLTASMSEAAAAESTMASQLPGSTFLTDFLFNHTGGNLYSSENRDSLKDEAGRSGEAAQLAELRKNFRDLAFRVVLVEGPFSRFDPASPSALLGPVRSPFTRRVRVELKMLTPGAPTFDPPDLAFETTMQTPGESLPLAEFKQRQKDTDDYSYEKERTEARASVTDAVTTARMPATILELLEDVYLVMSQSVGESIRTGGDDLGFGIAPSAKGFQQWIGDLTPTATPYARMKMARLEEDTMVAIFRAFRKSDEPMRMLIQRGRELDELAQGLVERIEEKEKDYKQALVKKPHRTEAKKIFEGSLDVAKEIIFWVKFFEDGRNFEAISRPMGWPDRYRTHNRRAIERRLELSKDPQLTPLNQVKNLKYLLESSKAMSLMANLVPPPSAAAIAQEQVDRAGSFLPLSQYLSHDNLDDPDDLRARNEPYLGLCASMAELLAEGGPYAGTLELVRPGGKWRQDLDRLVQMMTVMKIQADVLTAIDSVNARIRQSVRSATAR